MRAPCVDGPADGALVALVSGDERWIDPLSGRGYCKRAPGRALYVKRGRGARARWVFAGHEAGHCQGCGVRIAPQEMGFHVERCELCGRRRPTTTEGDDDHGRAESSSEGKREGAAAVSG